MPNINGSLNKMFIINNSQSNILQFVLSLNMFTAMSMSIFKSDTNSELSVTLDLNQDPYIQYGNFSGNKSDDISTFSKIVFIKKPMYYDIDAISNDITSYTYGTNRDLIL